MKRRKYIKTAALGTGAITFGPTYSFASNIKEKVKIGFIGVGGRGRSLLNELLALNWVEVPAICDINPEALASAQEISAAEKKRANTGKTNWIIKGFWNGMIWMQ